MLVVGFCGFLTVENESGCFGMETISATSNDTETSLNHRRRCCPQAAETATAASVRKLEFESLYHSESRT